MTKEMEICYPDFKGKVTVRLPKETKFFIEERAEIQRETTSEVVRQVLVNEFRQKRRS